MLIVTPLTFLGGAFYSIDMLPPAWRTFSLFNPVVYLISGFRWCFYGKADVNIGGSFGMIARYSCRLPRRGRLDLPHRLPPEELTSRRIRIESRVRRLGAAPVGLKVERGAGEQIQHGGHGQADEHRDIGASQRLRRRPNNTQN